MYGYSLQYICKDPPSNTGLFIVDIFVNEEKFIKYVNERIEKVICDEKLLFKNKENYRGEEISLEILENMKVETSYLVYNNYISLYIIKHEIIYKLPPK